LEGQLWDPRKQDTLISYFIKKNVDCVNIAVLKLHRLPESPRRLVQIQVAESSPGVHYVSSKQVSQTNALVASPAQSSKVPEGIPA
jgi:hypothetical protein